MHAVKPALAISLLTVLVGGCEERPRVPAAAVDDCRYTVRRPERQVLRAWDGRFLDDERISCFGRSRCLVGFEDTRVYRQELGRLVIEVGERRWQRAVPRAVPKRIAAWSSLGHAVVSQHAVALVGPAEIEVLWAGGEATFPRPALEKGEAFGGIALVGNGIGMSLIEHEHAGLPVRPFVWLRAPTAQDGGSGATSAPMLRDGVVIGQIERAPQGWKVTLASGPSVVVPLDTPAPPGLWITRDGDVIARDEERLLALAPDGARQELSLDDEDRVVGLDDRVYLLGPKRGVERVTASGLSVILARAAGHDLGGDALPKGAVVERLQVSGDDERRVAVIERIAFPGCRAEDRVHLVDVNARTVTTLASGDRVRLHPRFARGKLHFTEAESSYEVISRL